MVTVNFDKAVYRIYEPIQITFSGLTAGTNYTVKLKNSITGAERVLFSFIAPSTSATYTTYVLPYFRDYDKLVINSTEVALPGILAEVYTAPLIITTDQVRYKRGEAVRINMSNLIVGASYQLKITSNSGEILIASFTPTSSSETKLWSIPVDFPKGIHEIRLYQTFSPSTLLVGSTQIEVYEPTPTQPISDIFNQIMNFIMNNWWVLLIILIVVLLLF
jgi:hypothetical protein